MKTEHSSKLSVINGLRGVALLMVVFHHLPIHAWFQTRLHYIIGHTYAGVNLFFLLSGFVLFRPYATQNTYLSAAQSWGFYKKRFYRLYPLFFFNCLICLLFLQAPTLTRAMSALKALTTYSTFFGNDFMPEINWVAWSLMVEIWFSILFPVVLWMIYRTSLYKAALCIFLLSLTARILMALYPSMSPALILLSRFDDFYAGFLLYNFYAKDTWPSALKGWLGIFLGMTLLLAACLIGDLGSAIVRSLQNNLFQMGFAFLIMSALSSRTLFTSCLENKGIQLLGMMCFSVYLWHGVLIEQIIRTDFFWVDYLYYALAVMTVSAFTYRFIEFRKEESWRRLFLM